MEPLHSVIIQSSCKEIGIDDVGVTYKGRGFYYWQCENTDKALVSKHSIYHHLCCCENSPSVVHVKSPISCNRTYHISPLPLLTPSPFSPPHQLPNPPPSHQTKNPDSHMIPLPPFLPSSHHPPNPQTQIPVYHTTTYHHLPQHPSIPLTTPRSKSKLKNPSYRK